MLNHICNIHLHNADYGGHAMCEELKDIQMNK